MADYKDLQEISIGAAEDGGEEKYHSSREIGNVYRSRKIEKEWLHTPWPSGYAISFLHATLFEGIESYYKKGTIPLDPGMYRLDDVGLEGEADNFFVSGVNVKPIMQSFTDELDKLIESLPRDPICSVGDIIHKAAWAYYVFVRIHPFLDGNGRMGRIIAKRILKGAGLRSLLYAPVERGKRKLEENRDRHLVALNQVNKTGNLASLELYFATLLLTNYSPKETDIYTELKQFISEKNKEMKTQKSRVDLGDIWPPFKNLDIYGNEETLEEQEFSYSAPHTSN